MTKLVLYEIRKIVKLRFLQIVLCLCVLGTVILTAAALGRDEAVPYAVRESFYQKYEEEPEALLQDYADLQAFREEQLQLEWDAVMLGEEYVPLVWADRYSDSDEYTDLTLFSELFSRESYIQTEYAEHIRQICRDAGLTLLQLEANPQDPYAEAYQKQVILQYHPLPDKVEWKLSYPYGWYTWFHSEYRELFLYAAVIVITVCAYGYEKGGRPLLRVSRHGGVKTGVAKIAAVLLLCVAVTILLSLTTVCTILIFGGGMGDPLNAMQSISGMELVPYSLSILEGCLLSVLLQAIAAICFASICAVFCAAVPSLLPGVICSLFAFGFHYVLAARNSVFARLSLLSFGRGQSVFARYRAVNLFGHPISEWSVSLMLLAILLLLTAFLAIVLYLRNRRIHMFRLPVNRKVPKVKAAECPRQKPIKLPRRRSLLGWEFAKLWKRRGVCLGVLAILLFNLYLIYDAVPTPTSLYERLYQEYTEAYAGRVTQEGLDRIHEELRQYEGIMALADAQRERYESGSLSADEYKDYLNDLYRAKTRSKPAGVVANRMQRLYGTEGEILYDSGILRLLLSPFRPVELLLMILLGCMVFLPEYDGVGDFARVLRAAKYGRKRTFLTKLLLVVILGIIVSLIGAACEYSVVSMRYGIPTLTVPTYSLDGYSGSFPIYWAVILRTLAGILSVVCAGFLSLCLYLLTKRSVASIVCTASVCILPCLLTGPGMPVLLAWMAASVLLLLYAGIRYCIFKNGREKRACN